MQTQQVDVTNEQAEFIRRSIESGAFKTAGEVMRAALDALQRDSATEREPLARTRDAIDVGLAELARGEGITIPADSKSGFARGRAEAIIRIGGR